MSQQQLVEMSLDNPVEASVLNKAKPIYIYPGLLRTVRRQAVALDAKCPALVYRCLICEGEVDEDGERVTTEKSRGKEGGGGASNGVDEGNSYRMFGGLLSFGRKNRADVEREKSGRKKDEERQGTKICSHHNACAICMDVFHSKDLVRRLPCGEHALYHSRCILRWLENVERCPLCNQNLDVMVHKNEHTSGDNSGREQDAASISSGDQSGEGDDDRQERPPEYASSSSPSRNPDDEPCMRPYTFVDRPPWRQPSQDPLAARLLRSRQQRQDLEPLPETIPTPAAAETAATSSAVPSPVAPQTSASSMSSSTSTTATAPLPSASIQQQEPQRAHRRRRWSFGLPLALSLRGRSNSIASASDTGRSCTMDNDNKFMRRPLSSPSPSTPQSQQQRRKEKKSRARHYSYIIHDNVRFDSG